jgi:nucleoside-diphosphate-sugar epimerase
MKIVVIGGTGLIGSKSVAILRQGGHEVIAASPKVGVNTITADGLKETLADAHVVIDLSDSLSFDLKAVLYGALSTVDRRRTDRRRAQRFWTTIPHAYRMHVQTEFQISSAASDPEVHWAGRTRGHLDID